LHVPQSGYDVARGDTEVVGKVVIILQHPTPIIMAQDPKLTLTKDISKKDMEAFGDHN
jgi:hypothetical protein